MIISLAGLVNSMWRKSRVMLTCVYSFWAILRISQSHLQLLMEPFGTHFMFPLQNAVWLQELYCAMFAPYTLCVVFFRCTLSYIAMNSTYILGTVVSNHVLKYIVI